MRIEAVVLDMDGLLLDTEPAYKAAWQRAGGELGVEITSALYDSVIGRNEADTTERLVDTLGARFPLAQFHARWKQHWREGVAERGLATKPGCAALLEYLDRETIPYGIATSSDREQAALSLAAAGLGERFAIVVSGEQVAKGKPAPDIYLEAARRLGAAPPCCVALEDSEAGIHAAAAAGMTALLIPDLVPPSERARAQAFRVLASLHEARELIDGLWRAPEARG